MTFVSSTTNSVSIRNSIWIFGYGSLIWKPDMPFIEQRKTRLHNWSRKFWQGSHYHRGTADSPGRVVTLVPDPGAYCDGIAFKISQNSLSETFESLDFREKNGYERHDVMLVDSDTSDLNAVVYIAAVNNFAWLGPDSDQAIATQIRNSTGPSGPNTEYLLNLADSLRHHQFHDSHVFELERLVLATL